MNNQGLTNVNVYTLCALSDGTVYSGNMIDIRSLNLKLSPQVISVHGKSSVFDIAEGPNNTMYSCSSDNTVKQWSRINGSIVREFRGHTNFVMCIKVSPDGTIYSSCRNGEIRVWACDNETCIRVISPVMGAGRRVRAITISLDGKKVYSGDDNNLIHVWCGITGNHINTLHGHTGAIYRLITLPNGNILSGSSDGTVREWSFEGKHIRTLEGHNGIVRGLACNKDGIIFTGDEDVLRVWSKDQMVFHQIDKDSTPIMAISIIEDNVYIGYNSGQTLKLTLE